MPQSASPASPASWSVRTAGGLIVQVPARLSSLTTFVLLEQERWFEPEFDFLPALIEPGTNALDIGANHGVYTLQIAACLEHGRVWAFEPTAEPRERLRRSVQDNGFGNRVEVLALGLSDCARDAEFDIQGDSELNSLHGQGGRREQVRLDTLDAVLERISPPLCIDFVKIDVEGEEAAVLAGGERLFAEQSPLVMFEVKHAMSWNLSLTAQFERRGYELFRLLPELGLLAPFDPFAPGQDALLNLFACKPDRRQLLAERGLLAQPSTTAGTPPALDEAAALQALACRPFARDLALPAGDDPAVATYRSALAHAAAARLGPDAGDATRRLQHVRAARALLGSEALPAGTPLVLATELLRIHLDEALGAGALALQRAAALRADWAAQAGTLPLCLPIFGSDIDQQRQAPIVDWAAAKLAEYLLLRTSYSTYFKAADPVLMRASLSHPDHGAEMERRYALGEMRQGRQPEASLLGLLPAARHTANAAIWAAVLAA